MSIKTVSQSEGLKLIRDRLGTDCWWLIPVPDMYAVHFVDDIVDKFYGGDNRVLLDIVYVVRPTSDVPILPLVLASKSCMSSEALSKLVGQRVTEDSGNVVLLSTAPISVLSWLVAHFDLRRKEGRS